MYTLNWQPPYDWSWMLGFLAARAVSGVETVADSYYAVSYTHLDVYKRQLSDCPECPVSPDVC